MSTKEEILRETGSYNHHHGAVRANIFMTSPFFDKRDIVQVKYEMIRAGRKGEGSITEIASAYGFSRKSYYQISGAFEMGGLGALVPKKPGPKGPTKLNPELQEFIEKYFRENRNAKAGQAAAALEREKGIKVHTRTIYRYLKKN